jgi:hypothetical protein
VLLEPMLRTAAEQRDRLVIATALAAPASTFPLISEPLADELRETMAGAADPENRRVLKRLRELIDACDGPSAISAPSWARMRPGWCPTPCSRWRAGRTVRPSQIRTRSRAWPPAGASPARRRSPSYREYRPAPCAGTGIDAGHLFVGQAEPHGYCRQGAVA